jgi:hypothetical protein
LVAWKAKVSDRVIAATLQKGTPEPDSPREMGVFVKKGDNWIKVLPKIVYWKMGGVFHKSGSSHRFACNQATFLRMMGTA